MKLIKALSLIILLTCLLGRWRMNQPTTEAKTLTDYTENYQGDRRICKPERHSFGFPNNY